jgi:hypothetical protein
VSVLVAVTDHAAERFRQRVGSSRGEVDVKPEIVARVSAAVAAGRVSDEPRGSVHVTDVKDRSVVYVCRREGAELVVVTLWEREGGVAPARVPKRFTDVLRRDDERKREP